MMLSFRRALLIRSVLLLLILLLRLHHRHFGRRRRVAHLRSLRLHDQLVLLDAIAQIVVHLLASHQVLLLLQLLVCGGLLDGLGLSHLHL